MAEPGFLAMRASLVERGLLTADHRLTSAGNAHVDELLAELPKQECDVPVGRPIRWRSTREIYEVRRG